MAGWGPYDLVGWPVDVGDLHDVEGQCGWLGGRMVGDEGPAWEDMGAMVARRGANMEEGGPMWTILGAGRCGGPMWEPHWG